MNQNQPIQKNSNIIWFFVIFFSTFIIVDICYIFVAEKTWRGLAIEDGYQKGLKYNQAIEAVTKQKQLGWNLQINYQLQGDKNGNLEAKLLDKNNQTIIDADVVANIRRPVQDGVDFSLPLQFNSKTLTYQSLVEFPLAGQWDVEVIVKKQDDVYQDIKRLVIHHNLS